MLRGYQIWSLYIPKLIGTHGYPKSRHRFKDHQIQLVSISSFLTKTNLKSRLAYQNPEWRDTTLHLSNAGALRSIYLVRQVLALRCRGTLPVHGHIQLVSESLSDVRHRAILFPMIGDAKVCAGSKMAVARYGVGGLMASSYITPHRQTHTTRSNTQLTKEMLIRVVFWRRRHSVASPPCTTGRLGCPPRCSGDRSSVAMPCSSSRLLATARRKGSLC